MNDPNPSSEWGRVETEQPLLTFVNIVLRKRRTLFIAGMLGGVLGGTAGLMTHRTYESRASFVPNSAEQGLSGLALAASQFGVDVPLSTGGAWGASLYVRLLQTSAMLGSVAAESLEVAEEGNRETTLSDLLEVTASRPERITPLTIEALRRLTSVRENRATGSVEIVVTTRWPSVSQAIAERLVARVHRFNVEKLQASAAAERVFVESRVAVATDSLRAAEFRLQSFLQQNRAVTNSPELTFRRDRLQRDVSVNEQLYTGLLKGLDEARVREVRNTPVITVVEEPQLAILPKSRRAAMKAALGLLVALLLALLLEVARETVRAARQASGGATRELVEHLDRLLPAWLRRWLA